MPARTRPRAAWRRLTAAVAAALVLLGGATIATPGGAGAAGQVRALPAAECGPGSRPESDIPGRVPAEDFASGRAMKGYWCNVRQVGHTGRSGGFKVHRYEDAAGHVCAYYDVARAFPLGALQDGIEGVGTAVLDMRDPSRPVRTATLTTPAMLSPHESLYLHEGRGLLVAVMGNLLTAPGVLDVYDVSQDCRHPVLLSSTPMGILGHESGFSPDGRTFWASAMVGYTITAIDLTEPRLPVPVATINGVLSHGVRTSPDGRTLYVADLGKQDADHLVKGGLRIYDVSEIQDRVPGARARLLANYMYPESAIPQVPEPMRIKGHDYLLMVDEFSELRWDLSYRAGNSVAVAHIIDVDDPRRPVEVSALRLQVHLEDNREGEQADDPGAQSPVGGYAAHYCDVPRYRNPRLVACSYIASGLRIFDVSDPHRPREVGYFNKPTADGGYAMAKPEFDRERRQVWFSDVNAGFFAVRLADRIWPKGL